MRVLIAEDDIYFREVLELMLTGWGYQVIATRDGIEALEALMREDAPLLAVLDVMMPGRDGIDVCRKVRQLSRSSPPYIILLTAKARREDVVKGLEAGANDYIAKPPAPDELRARLLVGERVVELQQSLARRVEELEGALARIKQLEGILSICAYCKKIRAQEDLWEQLESYISSHSEARFSHSVCPDCYQSIVRPKLDKLRK